MLSVTLGEGGRRILSASEGRTIITWDLVHGELRSTVLKSHECYLAPVARDGSERRMVSGSGDKTIRVWDFYDRAWVHQTIGGHDSVVQSVEMFMANLCL